MDMEILLGSQKHDPDLRLLLSEPLKVETLLREVEEPWVDWLDFSTAVLDDGHFISEVFAPCEGCVLWKLRTKDGVQAHVFVGLNIERGVIQVDYRLEEPENATLWRIFQAYLDSKLATFGIDLSAAESIEEYRDLLTKRLEDRS